jgi:hypothetical protein
LSRQVAPQTAAGLSAWPPAATFRRIA